MKTRKRRIGGFSKGYMTSGESIAVIVGYLLKQNFPIMNQHTTDTIGEHIIIRLKNDVFHIASSVTMPAQAEIFSNRAPVISFETSSATM